MTREGVRGGIPKATIEHALTRYNRASAKGVQRIDQQGRQLAMHQSAVEAFCRACEPEGKCRAADCDLRPVSPLPLLRGDRDVSAVGRAEGAWGPSHRAGMLSAIRDANARRWAKPGERDRASQQMRDRHAAMTTEERERFGASISAGRRAS